MYNCCESNKCSCGSKECNCKAKSCDCKSQNCGCMSKTSDCKNAECECKKTGRECKGTDCGCTIKDCNCKKMASGTSDKSEKSSSGSSWLGSMFEGDVRTISAEELKEKMESESDIFVVNVLSEDYYQKCHIKDSINVPLDQLQGVASESWSKGDYIVVYCANYECPASKNAFKLLEKLGFTNVFAYEGGIKEWCQKGYPIVGECATE